MAVLSLLSLALALACANASARSGVLRCPERPASCTLCPSTGPLWAPSWSIFYDGEPEDHHQGVLGGSLDDPLGKFCQGNSIAIKFLAPLTEMYHRRHGDRGSCWALPLLVAHEIGYARVFELGLWQLLL